MPDTYVAISRLAPPGMVAFRGDLSAAKVKSAVKSLTGIATPAARQLVGTTDSGAVWMSPDELLLFCGPGAAPALAAGLSSQLHGIHHLAADVSDLRAMWSLTGEAVREVLAKLTPADVAHLPIGEVRRTRLGQVAGAIWLVSDSDARVVAFRSVADYVTGLLEHSARVGSEVG